MGKQGKRAKSGDGDREPRLMKWIGAITAVLSLVFAVQQAIQLVSDTRERQRQITELKTVARQQQEAGDYPAAWASFERAIETAEPSGQLAKLTGQLSDQRRQLREAQEDLAMVWLENIQVKSSEGETFSQVVSPIDQALNRGIANGNGARKADLLAHSGWANFLKWRDGRQLDPDNQYKEALAVDSGNPYANAYRAHWLLWTRRGAALSEARILFETALSSGRVKDHVRRIQLAALRNLSSDGEGEYIAAINEMRTKGEAITPQARRDLWSIYSFACGLSDDNARLAAWSKLVPAPQQLATFEALFFGADKLAPDENPRPGADACLAVLSEAAGQPDKAIPVWKELAARYPPTSGNRIGDRARDAMKRLRARSALSK
jgi:hypothetical protein